MDFWLPVNKKRTEELINECKICSFNTSHALNRKRNLTNIHLDEKVHEIFVPVLTV